MGVEQVDSTAGPAEAPVRRSLRRLRIQPQRATVVDPSFRPQASAGAVYLASIAGGVATALAWLVPETAASAILGWVGAILLVWAVRARRAWLPAYCGGLAGHPVAFYWIYPTATVFGGFSAPAAALVFVVFVLWGAVLLLAFAWIYHQLGPFFDRFALRAPIAIALAELVSIRLFPWHFGHTQIAATPFVQLAGLGGPILVSFMLFWAAELGVRTILDRERRRGFLLPAVALGLSLNYGAGVMREFDSTPHRNQDIILVQGNGALADLHEESSIRRVIGRISDLTQMAARPNALVVWPEGSIPAFLPADMGSVREEPMLPWLQDGQALLAGAYSYRNSGKRYNAAFAVYPDGTVPLPYFKQILIPFGEYVPGSSLFPWLNSLNKHAGVFTAGRETKVFAYPMQREDGQKLTVKVAPLICYEDTVPQLAREATRRGAELLVNLTYDTWFGRTAAPYQHHLIAAFRAIENRRFLVRATNSGYSAVVDPLGRTIARIRPFTAGTALVKVGLVNYESAYTSYVGEKPWWALLCSTLVLFAARRMNWFSKLSPRLAQATDRQAGE
jgi:apolipoprotein N-acyltransferase